MKKMRLFLLLFAAVLSTGSFTACSDDDETPATQTSTDYASAIAGEYVGNITLAGYTGSISTVLSFSKRNSSTVEMVLDSADADIHTSAIVLNVIPMGNNVYTVSTSDNLVTGTVTGSSCTVTLSTSSGAMTFQGTRR